MKFYKLRGIYIDDESYFKSLLNNDFFSSTENGHNLIINTKNILKKLSETKYWIQKYENEKLRTQEFHNRIKDLESKDEKFSIQNLEIEQLKKKQKELISLNNDLKKTIKEQEELNEKLKKRITGLISVRGAVDKFGTYKSLSKDIKILKYFMNNPNKNIRQKTLIKHFNKWSNKTVIRHLKKLVKNNLLRESDNFKGTYYFNPEYIKDTKLDMELIARSILGDEIFELAIISYIKKEKRIEKEMSDYGPYMDYPINKRKPMGYSRHY